MGKSTEADPMAQEVKKEILEFLAFQTQALGDNTISWWCRYK